jgi:hypothetical protein
MRSVASVCVATPYMTADEERLSAVMCLPKELLGKQLEEMVAEDSGVDATTVVPYCGDTLVTLAARSGCSHLLLSAMARVARVGRVTMTQIANGEVGGVRPGKPPLFDPSTVAVVELLLAHGAEVNRRRGSISPTDTAIFDGNLAVVKTLLCAGGETSFSGTSAQFYCRDVRLRHLLRVTEQARDARWSPLRCAWVTAVATSRRASSRQKPPKRRCVFGPK